MTGTCCSLIFTSLTLWCWFLCCRPGSSTLPKYQNILNLPSFDDAPPHVVPAKGSSVPSTPSAADVVGDPLANVPEEGGFVKHAQFNSPLQLYSDENAADALAAQSGGMVTALKRQTYVVSCLLMTKRQNCVSCVAMFQKLFSGTAHPSERAWTNVFTEK